MGVRGYKGRGWTEGWRGRGPGEGILQGEGDLEGSKGGQSGGL